MPHRYFLLTPNAGSGYGGREDRINTLPELTEMSAADRRLAQRAPADQLNPLPAVERAGEGDLVGVDGEPAVVGDRAHAPGLQQRLDRGRMLASPVPQVGEQRAYGLRGV